MRSEVLDRLAQDALRFVLSGISAVAHGVHSE
jgi:hypothetical protein